MKAGNGGSTYKYPLSLTSQFYFCGMPFRLDSYKGCSSGCVYCFVRSRNGNYSQKIQYANPNHIQKWFGLALDTNNKTRNPVIECLRQRMPIHFGGMSDPLLIPQSHQNVTLDILKILDSYKYPTLISTKANVTYNEKIADMILGKSHFALQISFSTFNDNVASIVEPNAPLPSQRIEGIKKAIENENWVACRLQPYFPGQKIDHIVDYIESLGFSHLTVEHFKLPFDGYINIEKLNTAFNIDLLKLFSIGKKIKRGREFEIPNGIRYEEIEKFINAAKKRNLPIGIGDNGFQNLSTTDCCCGIDTIPGFDNWFKHNITMAVRKAPDRGLISYEIIKNEWMPESNISEMINSKTRLHNMKDNVRNHIKTQWFFNKQFSPAFFYNVKYEKKGNFYNYFKNEI